MTLFVPGEPYPYPHDGSLTAENAALMVIDMQRDFCDPKGYLAGMGYDIGLMRAPLAAIGRALDAARRAGLHVIHTRQGYRADLADLPAFKRFRSRRAGSGIGDPGPLGRFLVRGEPGWEIVPELVPKDGEPVIDKSGTGAFGTTDLDQILRLRGVRYLVVTGITTDVCVHTTLREANDRSYECLLLADCCAATDPANHRAALNMARMEGGVFAVVSDSHAFIGALETLASSSRS